MRSRLLDIKALSSYICMPIKTIRKLQYCRKIPYLKIGSRVYFDIQEVDKWIDGLETFEPISRDI